MHKHEPSDYHCPLCSFIVGNESEYNAKTDIVYEDNKIMAFISPKWWPNNPGNIMIVPKEHVENIYNISDELLSYIHLFSKKVALAIKNTYGADGVSIRQHNEPHSGQDVWHFHLHVFPRWENDKLYQSHDDKKFVSAEERKVYADKIRSSLQE